MSTITAVTTSLPSYRMKQSDMKEFAGEHFGGKLNDCDRLLSVFDHAGVDTRYITQPISWFKESHSLAEKNQLYIEQATSLGAEVIEKILVKQQLSPQDIDYFIFINSTGLATPSIDARLINSLEMRKDIMRTPIWGLGCAGGASGLSHAYHYALGHPRQRVLLVALEFCGLTFISDDYSKSNLVATALFGDGAAAVIVEGDEVASVSDSNAQLKITGSQSRLYSDSLDVMGWHVVDQGLQVLFAQRIPQIVKDKSADDLSEFLQKYELNLGDIDYYLLHPGGTKVLEAYKQALDLDDEKLNFSREVLRKYGNMSSVTVLFVLEKFLASQKLKAGEYAIVSALGPGFSSETLLLQGEE